MAYNLELKNLFGGNCNDISVALVGDIHIERYTGGEFRPTKQDAHCDNTG